MRFTFLPRGLGRLPRKLVFTAVYVYCLLLVYRLQDVHKQDAEFRARLESEWTTRAHLLRESCSSAGDSLPLTKLQQNAVAAARVDAKLAKHYENLQLKEILKSVIYIPKRNLTWCVVPKVASTSWSTALLYLEGYNDNDILIHESPAQVILRNIYRPVLPDQVKTTIQPSLKFLFARHPFERIVSAFRNKLEDSYLGYDGEYFYKNYGRSIVMKFRVSGKAKEVMNYDEFRREPTFEEFVDYLIHTDVVNYDEHWKPIWLQCHVCQLEYDYVIKYEDFQEEMEHLLRLMKERRHLPEEFTLKWENKGGTGKNETLKYMSTISEHKLWLLYAKYQEDFKFFGYTMEGYTRSNVDDNANTFVEPKQM